MLHRARVCAVGTKNDMLRLCHALLDNCEWYGEKQADSPALTLEALIGLITHHARMEDAPSFTYEMVTPRPYGDAYPPSCKLDIRLHPAGVWLALFEYDSETSFQPEDWARLHRQIKGVPMMALYAAEDFALEKGVKLFIGGKTVDDWGRMGESWLWLIAAYGEGVPVMDCVLNLRQWQAILEEEEFDQAVEDVLEGCIANLEELQEAEKDAGQKSNLLEQLRAAHDFQALTQEYLLAAESALWDVQKAEQHLAWLEQLKNAWEQA